MTRDPFDGMSGDELDPQAAETDQLAALGMHAVEDEEKDDLDDEDEKEKEEPVETVDPSADLDKDGIQELEEMEKRLLAEEPILDFAMAEDE